MKVALITDTHWGVRGDSREFLFHMTKFYRDVFFPELEKRRIQRIIHLGDIVDRRKYINFVSLRTMREEFIEAAEDGGIHLDILVGNHDVPYRNTNEVNAIQEVCARYNHISLYSEPTEIEIDGTQILMMPWINSGNYDQCMRIIENTSAQIMFAHLEIAGFEMYRGTPSHDGFARSLFSKFDMVMSGHFHKKSTEGNIYYLGAPYEMTWSDYNCPRGFHIFDTATRELEYIRTPISMFHKVWYSDQDTTLEKLLEKDFSHVTDAFVKVIVQTKTNPYWFDLWLNKIYEAKPIEISVVDDHKNMDMLSDEDIASNAEDTPTILSNYAKALETRVDKQSLEKFLRTLYDEALDLDTASA